jgi:DNA-binding transcriptional LysR family regulator
MKPQIDIRQLLAFLTVAEELNFTRAAARLYVAQPALTKQIQHFEAELGLQLFLRDKRSVRLTAEGAALLETARTALGSVEHVAHTAGQLRRGEAGQITVAFTPAAATVLPVLMRTFRARFPCISCTLKEMTTADQVGALHAQLLDIGILRPGRISDGALKGLMFKQLNREPFVAVLPREHALAKGQSVSLRRMGQESFVLIAETAAPVMHHQILEACRAAGFVPSVSHEVTQMHAVAALVAAGCGVSVLPASIRHIRFREIVYKPLIGTTLDSVIGLAWSAASVTAPMQALVEVSGQVALPED